LHGARSLIARANASAWLLRRQLRTRRSGTRALVTA
jgi:hypothetical protein